MKQYPTIPSIDQIGTKMATDIIGEVCVQPKYDGSCIRSEWSSKKGFYKFGSRTRLITEQERPLGLAIPLIKKYETTLTNIFNKEGLKGQVICYWEFFGPSSFAGQHYIEIDGQENMQVMLLDIEVTQGIGFRSPRSLSETFSGVIPCPPLIYQGKLSEELIDRIREGTFVGSSFEGIVAKKHTGKYHNLMFKIKSKNWIKKVQEKYGAENAKKYL